jgi:hypothetical protein
MSGRPSIDAAGAGFGAFALLPVFLVAAPSALFFGLGGVARAPAGAEGAAPGKAS